MNTTCQRCKTPFEARRSDARFCSNACRTAANRARRAAEADAFRREAADLLLAQTGAIQAGDPAALAEVERRAKRLFG